nr:hypothetical protein 14 [Piscirickettsiaceae bacterium]
MSMRLGVANLGISADEVIKVLSKFAHGMQIDTSIFINPEPPRINKKSKPKKTAKRKNRPSRRQRAKWSRRK